MSKLVQRSLGQKQRWAEALKFCLCPGAHLRLNHASLLLLVQHRVGRAVMRAAGSMLLGSRRVCMPSEPGTDSWAAAAANVPLGLEHGEGSTAQLFLIYQHQH